MRKHSELEVFGIAYVDLMCLAFIGQIILWINQQEFTPPLLRNVLVKIEQFGVAHLANDNDNFFFVVDENLNGTAEGVPSGANNEGQVHGSLSGEQTLILGTTKITTSPATGTDGGSAGSFTISLAGVQNRKLGVWIPFFGRECRATKNLHQVHVTSITSSKAIWAAAFTFNGAYTLVTEHRDWEEVGAFLSSDPENRNKTWQQLLKKRLFVILSKPDLEPDIEIPTKKMILWLHLVLDRDGIKSLNFTPVAGDLGDGEGTSIGQESLSKNMGEALAALDAQLKVK